MANEEETETKRATEELGEMKPDPELIRMVCASKSSRYRRVEDD